MRIIGHTIATPELSVEEAVAFFAELGLDGVEILQDDDYRSGLPVKPTVECLSRLRRAFGRAGIRAVHIDPYVRTLDDPGPAVRSRAIDELRWSIDAAASLGAEGVRILAGRREGAEPARRRSLFVESMTVLAGVAGAAGVSLNIETKGWSFAADASSTLELLAQIHHPSVGVLLDPANMLLDGLDLGREVSRLASAARHLHVKDYLQSEGGGWSPAPLGSGSVPWPSLFAGLAAAGYRGSASLEYERRWHPDALPPAATGLPQELQRLRAWGVTAAVTEGER